MSRLLVLIDSFTEPDLASWTSLVFRFDSAAGKEYIGILWEVIDTVGNIMRLGNMVKI